MATPFWTSHPHWRPEGEEGHSNHIRSLSLEKKYFPRTHTHTHQWTSTYIPLARFVSCGDPMLWGLGMGIPWITQSHVAAVAKHLGNTHPCWYTEIYRIPMCGLFHDFGKVHSWNNASTSFHICAHACVKPSVRYSCGRRPALQNILILTSPGSKPESSLSFLRALGNGKHCGGNLLYLPCHVAINE